MEPPMPFQTKLSGKLFPSAGLPENGNFWETS
jgi:hypothetical protein